MKSLTKIIRLMAVAAVCVSMAGCDDVRVYGSVGYSGYSGYGGYHGGGPRYGTGVSVGGRLY
jgi:hypothetical protein